MSARGRRARRAASRGFTLVELLVALGLTAVVAVGLYSLSMVASQTFQQQQRISEVQLRLRGAIELLRSDVQRAGYMSTPASPADVRVCPKPTTPVQAVALVRDTPNPTYNPADNAGIAPVRLRLTGNYASTDEYRIMDVQGNVVQLQQHTPEYLRIADAAAFDRIFKGRVVRLRGTDGVMQFGLVNDTSWQPATGGAFPTLTLATPPVMQGGGSGSGGSAGCFLAGLGIGATIAPITTVEYRIGNVAATQANAYAGIAQFVTGKTDLVRTELLPGPGGDAVRPFSERIAAEYAVDFDVAGVFDGAAVGTEPLLVRYAFGATQNFDQLGAAGAGSSQPQRLRALAIRLSVRDRAQDPDFGWVARPSGAPLTRFRVFPTQSGAARVRSAVVELTLPNLIARSLR